MADDAVNRIGTMLEELGARFELVIEAVSGSSARLDALRQELFGQFAEVGGQIRFLSEQIAENRRGIAALKSDLSAEMVRLGETLGRTRVEFREQRGAEVPTVASSQTAATQEGVQAVQHELVREMTETAKALKRELAMSAESTSKKLGTELNKTNKALQNLAQKFDRFDDRITIQTKDQDQRLKKLERKKSA